MLSSLNRYFDDLKHYLCPFRLRTSVPKFKTHVPEGPLTQNNKFVVICHLLIFLKTRFRSRCGPLILKLGLKYIVPHTKKVAQTLISLIWLTSVKMLRPWCKSEKVYPVSGIIYFKVVLNWSIQLNYFLTLFTFGYEHSLNPKTKKSQQL